MKNIRTWPVYRSLIFGLLICGLAAAQKNLVLPPPPPGIDTTQAGPEPPRKPGDEAYVRFGYANGHESAVAALLAGIDAANTNRKERALWLFLTLSVGRESSYAAAVYDLGIMSARMQLWDDAASFYREAERLDPSPEMAKLVNADLPRVELIAKLDSTAEGQRRRRFDSDLTALIGRFGDPAIALDGAAKLMQSDPGRWEAPAAAGIMQARLGKFDDSAKSLAVASQLAPPDRRQNLSEAAELARREGEYTRLVQDGDAAMAKPDYQTAAKLYADAWEASPARVQTGMQSAIAFLMADQVPLGVEMLLRVHQVGSPEMAEKAGMMLKELGAISADAKAGAAQERSGEAAPVVDVAARIPVLVGDLLSADIKLAGAPAPPLLSDNLKFVHVSDDEINNPKEITLTSNESLFSKYQHMTGGGSASQPPAAPVADAPADAPVSSPAGPPPPPPLSGRPAPFGQSAPSAPAPQGGSR